ncbi:ATP-binding protein [Methanonatronarchaeum sp. AMET-Sl]|uniref:ATP-binding protein n=1 Tax=Methanonatronarchaeum sp. AMET-Sl TaxID=3037654 RepID=UPI00244DDAE9|nr:ATP-binding protein [Methanonatronarchaeum sp. AMET-Sl]WGI17479.1 ATP-binding protein [Methanonatronarchaeum sp. AMET-Sl]
MNISVASGKGGTGKTTIATNLTLTLNPKKTQLLDCDVEEPDCHLFLNQGIETIETVYSKTPVINKQKCTKCAKCVQHCQFNAIAMSKKGIKIFPELCHSCGLCKIVCPENAVKEKKRPLGKIEKGTNQMGFYHGKLKTGELLSPRIIEAVKQKTKPNKTTIIDAPPGNACPTIAAIEGTDYCILVAEPTPFGLSDLKNSIKMLKQQKTPYGVVINKEGIGNNELESYCKQNNIPILMKIPNDRKIAKLYSEGIPFTDKKPEMKKQFKKLYKQIQDTIQ